MLRLTTDNRLVGDELFLTLLAARHYPEIQIIYFRNLPAKLDKVVVITTATKTKAFMN